MVRAAVFEVVRAGGWLSVFVFTALLFIGGAALRNALLWGAALPIVFLVVGTVALRRRPDQVAARWLMAVGGFHMMGVALSGWVLMLLPSEVGWVWLPNLVSGQFFFLGFAAYLGLFAVFPDGTYERLYERWAVRTALVAGVVLPVLNLLTSPNQPVVLQSDGSPPGVQSPFVVSGLVPLAGLSSAMFAAPLVGLALFVLRYRRADQERRLRMRWPLLSAVLGGAVLGLSWLLGPVPPPGAVDLLFVLVLASLPVTLFIGMVRHRLFDVDLIIRRSLVYGALWVGIALAYAGLAAALGMAAGERFPVNAAVVITIVASMVFHPVRRRLERMADRLVFGNRPTRYDALRRLTVLVGRGPELHELAQQLARIVHDAIDSRWVRVSITPIEEGLNRPLGIEGTGSEQPASTIITIPLIHDGELLGEIECGPRREGVYRASDLDLVSALAGQSALAVRNARLSDDLAGRVAQLDYQARELASSRVRLIQAEEAERRRIERDLHDGIQQELVALMARIELARARLDDAQVGEVDTTLSELQEMVRRTHAELRELARGIHPALLTDRGLVEAVEARTAKLPIKVTVESDTASRSARYPPEVEGAAYYLISEGLTNTMKHADADAVMVRIAGSGGMLHLEVEDEGCGFDADSTRGSGLRGLADRVEALGGQLRVESKPGSGTRLTAQIPTSEVDCA